MAPDPHEEGGGPSPGGGDGLCGGISPSMRMAATSGLKFGGRSPIEGGESHPPQGGKLVFTFIPHTTVQPIQHHALHVSPAKPKTRSCIEREREVAGSARSERGSENYTGRGGSALEPTTTHHHHHHHHHHHPLKTLPPPAPPKLSSRACGALLISFSKRFRTYPPKPTTPQKPNFLRTPAACVLLPSSLS